MKNSNSLFLVFCLCLTLIVLSVFTVFNGYFDGHEEYEIQISQIKNELKQEKLKNAMLAYQLKDFQQSVAQVLPDEKVLQAKYQLRNLASTVRLPASEDGLDLSVNLIRRGKDYFAEHDYEKAIEVLNELLEKYPVSIHVVEANFLIAESYFLSNEFEKCLRIIDQMVSHYPQHDLTGFILLRMGQISEMNNQTEEASEVYRMVAKSFSNEELRKQAKKMAQGVEYP